MLYSMLRSKCSIMLFYEIRFLYDSIIYVYIKYVSLIWVLRVFKELHRTRMDVFKEDDRALTAARLKINDEFRKNKNETVEENINQMIKMAAGVEAFLRQDVVQAEHVAEDKIRLRPRESLLLENVPYCDTPRNVPSSKSAPKQSCVDETIA
uniref:LYR motif containing 7 n=1 Tax=Esox lucius TaxID=8010 RepID=A0A3P8YJS3_ESOLU